MLSPTYTAWSSLLGQGLLLLVYLAGLIVAIVKWRHYPRPAMLTALAMALLLLASVGGVVTQMYVARTTNVNATVPALMLISLLTTVIRTGAFALLLVAVFASRERPAPQGFQVLPAGHAWTE